VLNSLKYNTNKLKFFEMDGIQENKRN
jgi:hypothetical protein